MGKISFSPNPRNRMSRAGAGFEGEAGVSGLVVFDWMAGQTTGSSPLTIDFSSLAPEEDMLAVLFCGQAGSLTTSCEVTTSGWTRVTNQEGYGAMNYKTLGPGEDSVALTGMSGDGHYVLWLIEGGAWDSGDLAQASTFSGTQTSSIQGFGSRTPSYQGLLLGVVTGNSGAAAYDGSGTWSIPPNDVYEDGREVTFGHSISAAWWKGYGGSIDTSHDHTSQAANWSYIVFSTPGARKSAWAIIEPV